MALILIYLSFESQSSGINKRKAEDELAPGAVLVVNETLLSSSHIHRLTKPLLDYVHGEFKALTIDVIFSKKTVAFGANKLLQLKEYIIDRVRGLFNLDSPIFKGDNLDSKMVDSACTYIKTLSMTGGGTNFSANDYAKNIVIISLIPEDLPSQRELSRRLGVPRKLISDLVNKRREFNLVAAKESEEKIIRAHLEDDESLQINNEEFAHELEENLAEQGLFLLFNAAFPDRDADIYFEEGLFFL